MEDGAPSPLRIGVLVSGRGTNLQALVAESRAGTLGAEIALVGCNRREAPAFAWAQQAGLPVALADRGEMPRRADRQRHLEEALRAADVGLVVLAGYDEILQPFFVAAFAGRMINTHPSLLPAFGGTMDAVGAALAHGVKVTGCTVHFVTDEPDGGPILLQRCVEVRPDDTVASLHARILDQEHRLLPAAVRAFAERRVRVENGRAYLIGSVS